jgi:hypothetical protein
MNTRNLMMCIAAGALLFTACKKGGDTIINNYGSSDNGKAPNRTMFKGYGFVDSSQTIRFAYQNNEIGKIKELRSFDTSGPRIKYVILYDGANKPEGYQSYTLPANTLNEQGTFKLDDKGRIIEVVKRELIGDTIGIAYFQYVDLDYQPSSFSFYNHSDKRFTRYEYYTYDNRGNVTRTVSYKRSGSNPLFREEEVEASGFGNTVNPLNQLYNYVVTISGDYGFNSSAPLYFSNYLPSSVRSQSFDQDGKTTSVSLNNYSIKTDANNNPISMVTSGSTSPAVYFRY